MSVRASVAIAAYQGEKYLPIQIDSVLEQLSKDDELVVSYDNSKDNTLELLNDYAAKDSRVKVFKNDNPGITGNFNNALANCRGEYIFICDQDDKWIEGKLVKVLKHFEEGAEMVIHNGTHTNAELTPIGKPFFEMYRIGDGKLKNFMKPRYSGCCIAFTKRIKEIILPIPEIYAYDHWVGMVGECFGTIAYEKDVLLLHRLHSDNVTPEQRRSLGLIFKTRLKLLFCLIGRKLRCLKNR